LEALSYTGASNINQIANLEQVHSEPDQARILRRQESAAKDELTSVKQGWQF